ncbi:site-specific integrase [uncultured Cloacibacillus sp.]|uniref:site-specific integrase n=1 Tax=uncultured Cloacibacillus sp. TaxID=889794 RepID=UPI0026DD0639|nr:site-specific integrase [uncultured Cloacibacillus sp.]
MAQTSEFLTANWIDRARPLKNQEQRRRDKDIPALFLRIRTEEEGGGKSWMLRYNDPVTGKRKSYALNGIPGTSQCWALAKEKAQEALRTIQLQMKTPREVAREEQELLRLKEEEEKRKGYKIADLILLYEPFTTNLRTPQERIRDLKNISRSSLGVKPVSQITSNDIVEFINQELSAGNTSRTINKKLTLLYGMLNKLHRRQVILPSEVSLPPKPEKLNESDSVYERRYLQPWERNALIEQSKDMSPEWLHYAIVISLNTGIRPNSLFHLLWADINWGSKTLFLRAAHMKTKDNWTIPLNKKAIEAFSQWRERHSNLDMQDLIFKNSAGTAVNKWRWNALFKELVNKTGLDPKLGWYNMRHDFASQLVMSGVNLYVVRDLMCHKNITTTQMYAHLAPDHKSAAVRLLDSL